MALMRYSVLPFRTISSSCRTLMPIKPEDRLPLSERQRRLYPQVEQEFTDEGFPILKLTSLGRNVFNERPKMARRESRTVFVPREQNMSEDQDWPSIWPVAKTFSPASVPLPLRQGYEQKPTRIPRGKHANTELVKIINFLHLTPPAIEKHCKAMQRFCTKWPKELDTDEQVRAHFPVTYVTRDYINSSPTIRDVRARVVHLKINLKDLKLNPVDEDKLLRLVDHRYDKITGEISITTSSCPTKMQNQDYSDYILTALYFESKKHEEWEDEKPEQDWEHFFWDKSESKTKLKKYLVNNQPDVKKEDIVNDYKKSLEQVFASGEVESYESYRSSVEKMLGL